MLSILPSAEEQQHLTIYLFSLILTPCLLPPPFFFLMDYNVGLGEAVLQ